MWFTWADPFDIVTAWRKVGIAGNVLAPELIDRSEFIDQQTSGTPAPAAAAEGSPTRSRKRSAEELSKTPEGMVSGSIESERAKVQALREYAQELEAARDAPFDQEAAGVLVPSVVTRPDKPQQQGRKRLSDLHGSISMRGVGDEARKRRLEDEAAAEKVEAAKQARAAKKAAEVREAAEREAAFARCEVSCTCVRWSHARGQNGGAAPTVGRRMVRAESRPVLPLAGRCFWVTTPRLGAKRTLKERALPGSFLGVRRARRCTHCTSC